MKFRSEIYCSEPYLDTAAYAELHLRELFREKILSAMKFLEESEADAVTFWCAADWLLFDDDGEQCSPSDHYVEQCNLKVMRGGFRFVLQIGDTTAIYDTDMLTLEDEVK